VEIHLIYHANRTIDSFVTHIYNNLQLCCDVDLFRTLLNLYMYDRHEMVVFMKQSFVPLLVLLIQMSKYHALRTTCGFWSYPVIR
jgi:hypothetical protein